MRFIFRSLDKSYACVAQLVEQLTLNQWVRGSNPRARTIKQISPFCKEWGYLFNNYELGSNPRGLEE